VIPRKDVYDFSNSYTLQELLSPVLPSDYGNITLQYVDPSLCKTPALLPNYRLVLLVTNYYYYSLRLNS